MNTHSSLEKKPKRTSMLSLGIFLAIFGIIAVMVPSGTEFGLGMLAIGISLCLAHAGVKHQWRYFPTASIIVGLLVGGFAISRIPRNPSWSRLILKSSEGMTRGNLRAIHSALRTYYEDTKGKYPTDDLSSLTIDGKYLSSVPKAKPSPHHPYSNAVSVGSDPSSAITDTGGWAYVNDPKSPLWGSFFVNCTHTDSRGKVWSSY